MNLKENYEFFSPYSDTIGKSIVSTCRYYTLKTVYPSDFRFVCDRLYDISKMDKRWRYLKDLALSHATNKGFEEKFGRIIESTQHQFLDH